MKSSGSSSAASYHDSHGSRALTKILRATFSDALRLPAALANAIYFFLAAALLPCFGFFDFLSFF
jgi:hypothetical protein